MVARATRLYALDNRILQMKETIIEMYQGLLGLAGDHADYADLHIRVLEHEIWLLKDKLADKEAEIVRLNILLESQAKRKRPGH